MDFYNTQMEISNEFNHMHALMMLAGSQLCILLMFCMSPSVSYKKKYDKLMQEYETLQAKNEKDVDDYNKLVDEHNALVEEHEALEKKNEKDIADYNKLVEDFNELTDENEKNVCDYNDLAEAYNELLDESETRVSRLESRLKRNRKY